MAHKIINKFKEPKYAEFSRKDLVIDIKNGILYYKSNLGVHRISSGLSTDTFGSGDVTNITQYNIGIPDTFKNDGIRVGDSSITGTLTITENNITTGDTTIGGNTTITGNIIVGQSASFGNVVPNPGLNINALLPALSSNTTASSNQIIGPASFFEAGDLVNISTGSYNQTVRVEDINTPFSMSINTSWAGPSTGSFIYNVDPDLFVVKASDGKTELKLDNRGNLDVEGNISASGGLFISSSNEVTSDILFYNTTTGKISHGTSPSTFTSTGISGSFTAVSASIAADLNLLTGVTNFKNTGQRDGDSSITGSLILSGSGTPELNVLGNISASNGLITNNLVVGGTITAQEFHTEFVSSSIIFTSGSTQFGNSSDDIHTFSGSIHVKDEGHITASGNISASGDLFGQNLTINHLTASIISASVRVITNNITASGNISASRLIFASASLGFQNIATYNSQSGEFHYTSSQGLSEQLDTFKVTGQRNGDSVITGSLFLSSSGHLTASGNISASSGVYGHHYIMQNHTVIAKTSNTIAFGFENNTPIQIGKSSNPTKIVGHTTASGNISASGLLYSSASLGFDNIATYNSSSGQYFYTSSQGLSEQLDTFKQTGQRSGDSAITGSLTVTNNITASGNISASGDIIGENILGKNISSSATLSGLTITGERATLTNYISASQLISSGHITASGNISASGTVTGNIGTFTTLTNVNTTHVTASGNISASGIITGNIGTFTTLTNVNTTHVTASGNVSSSGTVIGNVGTFGTLTNVNTTHVTASGNVSASGTVVGNVGTFTTLTNVNTTHVTASGNISASGELFGNKLFIDNLASIDTNNGDTGRLFLDGNITAIEVGRSSAPLSKNIGLFGPVTASGDISASGKLFGGLISSSQSSVVFYNDATGELTYATSESIAGSGGVGGLLSGSASNMTASGNLSASGTITANNFIGIFNGALSSSNQIAANISGSWQGQNFITASQTFLSTGQRSGDSAITGSLIVTNITASGNISASGILYVSRVHGQGSNIGNRIDLTTDNRIDLAPNNIVSVRLSDNLVNLNKDTFVNGHITASENISASGKLYSGLTNTNNANLVFYNSTTGELTQEASSSFLAGLLSSSAQIATDISGAIDAATGSLLSSQTFLSSSAQIAADISGSLFGQTASIANKISNPLSLSGSDDLTGGLSFEKISAGGASSVAFSNSDFDGSQALTLKLNIDKLIDKSEDVTLTPQTFDGGDMMIAIKSGSNETNNTFKISLDKIFSYVAGNNIEYNEATSEFNVGIGGSGFISSSVLSSPNQGTATLTTNGIAANVDLGLQTTDSPIFNDITASGDISASGRLIVSNNTGQGSQFFGTGGNNTVTINAPDLDYSKSSLILNGGLTIALGGNITASSNISASGKLFGGLTNLPKTNSVFYDSTTGELTYGAAGNISSIQPISASVLVTGNLSQSNDGFGNVANGIITAVGGAFNTEIHVGDAILLQSSSGVPSEIFTVQAIDTNNQLTLDSTPAFSSFSTNLTASLQAFLDPNLLEIKNSDNKIRLFIDKTGNIRSSGSIYLREAEVLSFDNESDTDQFITGQDNALTITGDNRVNLRANTETRFQTTNGTTYTSINPDGIDINGDVTASNAISASGHLFAGLTNSNNKNIVYYDDSTGELTYELSSSLAPSNTFKSTGHRNGDSVITGSLFLSNGGHLTASGNISASGDIYATGNIGIGTDSPNERLHVIGEIDNDDVAIHIQNTSDDNNASTPPRAALLLSAASNNAYFRLFGAPDDAASGHKIDIGATAGNSFLTFTPSNTERMRITSDGEVGIGTTTPPEKLTVAGNISASGDLYFKNAYANDQYRLQDNDGTSRHVLKRSSTNKLELGNSNFTEGLLLSGNVTASNSVSASGKLFGGLISSSQPSVVFYNDATGELTYATSESIAGSGGGGGSDNLGNHTATQDLNMDSNSITSANNISASGTIFTNTIHTEDNDFHLFGNNTTTGFYFDESVGTFGLGTQVPQSRLHIQTEIDTLASVAQQDFDQYQLLIYNKTNTVNAFAGIAFNASNEINNHDSIGAAIRAERQSATSNNNNTDLTFATNNANNDGLIERVRITSTGDVGIGNFSSNVQVPHKLTVQGDISASGTVYSEGSEVVTKTRIICGNPLTNIDDDGGATAHHKFIEGPNINISGSHSGTDPQIKFSFQPGGVAAAVHFNNNSTTAMGTPVAEFTFDETGNDELRVAGDIIAYETTSDKRLKNNIKPLSNSLKKIIQIGGYEFDWNENQNTYNGHDVGIIAQEIEEVLPEAVETRANGYKAVQYKKIIPLLIEGIKDQQKQIDELKELINKLIEKDANNT